MRLIFLILLASCASQKKESGLDRQQSAQIEQSSKLRFYTENLVPRSAVDAFVSDDQSRSSKESILEGVRYKSDFVLELNSRCNSIVRAQLDERYSELLEQYRRHPQFWNTIAGCYIRSGDLVKAKIFVNRSLDIESNYPPAMNSMGIIIAKEGDLLAASQIFEQTFRNARLASAAINECLIHYQRGSMRGCKNVQRAKLLGRDVQYKALVELMKSKVDRALSIISELRVQELHPYVSLAFVRALKASGKEEEAKRFSSDLAARFGANSSLQGEVKR